MDLTSPLRGACSCGRNHFLVSLPSNPSDVVQVLYDDRAEHSRASLRVPLTTIQSTTYAFYPEETPSQIRRVFSPTNAPQTKRHFCGFCGTPLSYWSEESPEEAEWICVNLGSLRTESMDQLEEAGLLSSAQEVNQTSNSGDQIRDVADKSQGRQVPSHPWFEEMIQGSELGRIRRRRGGETSSDGKITVEWEIVEIGGDNGDATPGKRKHDSLGEGDDAEMHG